MKKWFIAWNTRRRDRKAARIRQQIKRQILLDDMDHFYDGTGTWTVEQSRQYRDECYARLDAMTTDEVLNK